MSLSSCPSLGHRTRTPPGPPHRAHLNLASALTNQSIALGEVGRREDALVAVEEAVGLYRRLAQARPDAFEPHLAMALNNQSNCLAELERHKDAFTAIDNPARVMLPRLERRPFELPDCGLRLAQNYIERCSAAQLQPDSELIERYDAVLSRCPFLTSTASPDE